MGQTREGALKVAAKKCGISETAYASLVAKGEKWCFRCRAWHPLIRFGVDTSRFDRLAAACRESSNNRGRATYVPRSGPRPGRSFVPARDGDKKQARRRVNHFVDCGLLLDPDDLACADCGHRRTGPPERRHEYDHHLGYAAEHHEHVESVCTICHKRREKRRGGGSEMPSLNTTIEWTDATWGPVRGCTRVSEGCRNCYAERLAARFSGPGMPYEGLAENTPQGPRWAGVVRLVPEHLADPLKWKRPRRIFVNSMSDLFHEGLSFEDIAAVYGVMATATQHTFQVLTKRPERRVEFFGWAASPDRWVDGKGGDPLGAVLVEATDRLDRPMGGATRWPLPNVWEGVSVEDQATADQRVPELLGCPAAVHFVSAEPLLSSVILQGVNGLNSRRYLRGVNGDPRVSWVIVGGESGPGARPMHPEWARSLRDQCVAAGVPFLFKQWGEYASRPTWGDSTGRPKHFFDDGGWVERVGKKTAGRLLDGKEWSQYPGEQAGTAARL